MRAVVLLLGGFASAALAQMPAIQLPPGMRMPTPQEMQDLQRQSAEMQRLTEEVQSLRRQGRMQEAEAAARKLDELLKDGYVGSMMRGMGLPSMGDAIARDREMVEKPEAWIPPPLFVQPEPLMGSKEAYAAEHDRGVELHRAGDRASAIHSYELAIEAMKRAVAGAGHLAGLHQAYLAVAYANLGLAHWQDGDPGRALEAFRVALDERSVWEAENDPFQTERAALAKSQALGVELHAILTLERQLGAAAGAIALQTLLERKGAVLERQARSLAGFRREAQSNRDNKEDRQLLAQYQAATAERAALAGRPVATPEAQAEQRRRVADLDTRIQVMQREMQLQESMRERENEVTEKQERERQQRVRDSRRTLPARVQERVPEGALLVEMVKYRPFEPAAAAEKRWGAPRYGAYLLARTGAPVYVDLGEAAPIERLVQEFRRALANPERLAGRELGRRLDEAVMRPVRAAIAARFAGVRTLYVAPEGALNLAPLAALVDEEGRYLLERFTLTYLASGRDLLVLGRDDPPRSPPLVLADPAFSSSIDGTASKGANTRSIDFRATRYERLPGTAAEAAALKRLMPDAVVLTGTQATETAAKRASGPRILHIATHGFFLEDAPAGDVGGTRSLQVAAGAASAAAPASEDPMLRSGLVFAGVNALSSAEDDGVLTALEAAALDLRGTRLVVLSACETGLGEIRNGEGVFGLRRAFVVAGAETLLMSLWQVADEATKDLMAGYYTRLARGEPRAEALRQAQLALLKDPRTASPFFWAAFISSGEAGALK